MRTVEMFSSCISLSEVMLEKEIPSASISHFFILLKCIADLLESSTTLNFITSYSFGAQRLKLLEEHVCCRCVNR